MSSNFENKNLIESVISIAKCAGQEILKIYKLDDVGIINKKDNSPLTLADNASNDVICNQLKKLTPDIPILSEEGKDIPYSERKKWNTFWLIDPLDGTKEFIKKNGEFSVNIALINHFKPILGVVYAPVNDTIWYGCPNTGSYKIIGDHKPKKINVLKSVHNEKIKIVSSRSHSNNSKLNKFLENYPQYELVFMGSSIKICLVADGSAHLYPRLGPTMEWDTAAAHAVVTHAGGNIRDLEDNNELSYNKENLLNPSFLVNNQRQS